MEQNKQYEIRNFQHMCNIVTDENIECLLVDFANCFTRYNAFIQKARKEFPQLADQSNWELCEFGFDWTDDGKNDYLGLHVTDKKTGEKQIFKP